MTKLEKIRMFYNPVHFLKRKKIEKIFFFFKTLKFPKKKI